MIPWNRSVKEINGRGFMEARFSYVKAAPGVFKAMLGLAHYLHECGLEESLLTLVDLRASQINGCAYCIDMHQKDLQAMGERATIVFAAWRESPFYGDRERAALEWTTALTL
jgi:AhpD family alkylhydroperoxidase